MFKYYYERSGNMVKNYDAVVIGAGNGGLVASARLRQRMEQADKPVDTTEFGTVLSVGDGIARVDGLTNVMYNELVETENGVAGLALNLEEDVVGVAILDSDVNVREGDRFHRTGRVVSVPAGPALTGQHQC